MIHTRLFALLVSVAMALALAPACALAEESGDFVSVDGSSSQEATKALRTVDDLASPDDAASPEASAPSNGGAAQASLDASSQVMSVESTELSPESVDVASYSYQAQPLLAPFNNLIYVKTDNPDPTSFRLVDASSTYVTSSDAAPAFEVYQRVFADVVYENESTYRVNSGYIFFNYSCTSDGGTLSVQRKSGSSWVDTGRTVSCAVMEDDVDYLINTYAAGETSLFDKLDAVQNALDQLAYYPAAIKDKSKPSSRPYPFLATSPYYELTLNEHYEMYLTADERLLAKTLYPYILDSASFPGTMRAVAKKLDPSCTITRGSTHPYIDVTSNGTTRTYGGAGQGGNDPIYTDRATKDFTFTGASGDLALNGSLASIGNRYSKYQSTAVTDAQPYKDEITGAQLAKAIGSGSWVRVAREGSSRDDFAYIAYGFDGYPNMLSDAWVDGRYIDNHERFDPTATFADHSTASIVLRDQSYTDYYGNQHQNDIAYEYDSSTDTWRAPYYYSNHWSYSSNMTLPSQFILTRSQVETMLDAGQIDGSRTHIPTSFLIYDGRAYPGTPGTATQVAGVSLPASHTAAPSSYFTVTATVSPADASYPTYLTWASDNTAVANVYGSSGSDTAMVYTTSQTGTAHITVTTWDGQYVATMTLVVENAVAPQSIEGAVVSDIPDQTYTGDAITPSFTVTLDGKQLAQGDDYRVSYANNTEPGTATVTITGVGSYTGAIAKSFRIVDNSPHDGARVERLAGDISDDTAAAIAARAFEGTTSSNVVICRDDTYYDALSGAGLAGALGAPILLTNSAHLSDSCRSAIEKAGADHAVILGGESAISAEVAQELEAMGLNVARVAGDNVYGTSMACTQVLVGSGYGNSQYAIACNPTNFADAVSISGWAYANKVPVMLQTWGNSAYDRGFDSDAARIIAGRDLIVCGGEFAVCDASVQNLGAASITRLGGATLYDTSLEIAKWELNHGMSASYVSLASCIYAFNGVDALAASALAGRTHGVVLLVQSNPDYEPYVETSLALNFISDHRSEVEAVYVLGGETASTPKLFSDAQAALAGARF